MPKTLQPKTRNQALDLTRAVAILAVILIHISADFLTDDAIGSASFLWGNLVDGVTRIGVPLFVMTSGALMLEEDRQLSSRELLCRRIPRLVALLVCWSGVYALIYDVLLPLSRGEWITLRSVILAFVDGHYHLWYLYMQIGLYLALPFLRCFVSRQNRQLVLAYLAIALAARFALPILSALAVYTEDAGHLKAWLEKFRLDFFSGYVSYYLAGWYIVHVGVPRKWVRRTVYGLSALSLGAAMTYVARTNDFLNAYIDESLFVFVYAVGVFLGLNQLCQRRQGPASPVAAALAKYSFGMYAVHVAVMDLAKWALPKDLSAPVFMAVSFCIVALGSFGITWALARIPGVKKIVRG